jgi:hypothetical protein
MAPEVERGAPLWTFDRPIRRNACELGRFGQAASLKSVHLHAKLQMLVQDGQFALNMYYPL